MLVYLHHWQCETFIFAKHPAGFCPIWSVGTLWGENLYFWPPCDLPLSRHPLPPTPSLPPAEFREGIHSSKMHSFLQTSICELLAFKWFFNLENSKLTFLMRSLLKSALWIRIPSQKISEEDQGAEIRGPADKGKNKGARRAHRGKWVEITGGNKGQIELCGERGVDNGENTRNI